MINMVLQVDDREPREIVDILRYERGLDVEVVHLASGDYVFSNMGIERKSYKDYLGSLSGGKKRLWDQVFRLRMAFEKPVLIVDKVPPEGEWDKSERIRVMSSVSRIVRQGISVIMVGEPYNSTRPCSEQFLDFIMYAFLSSDRKRASLKPVPKKGEYTTTSEITEDMLCMIPGVSRRRAKEIMLRFPKLDDLVDATTDQLEKIPLIGAKTAKIIQEVLHEDINYKRLWKDKQGIINGRIKKL